MLRSGDSTFISVCYFPRHKSCRDSAIWRERARPDPALPGRWTPHVGEIAGKAKATLGVGRVRTRINREVSHFIMSCPFQDDLGKACPTALVRSYRTTPAAERQKAARGVDLWGRCARATGGAYGLRCREAAFWLRCIEATRPGLNPKRGMRSMQDE